MPGVRPVMPGTAAAVSASIRACTRIRRARSSCIGPYSTSTLSSPLRRYVTSSLRYRMPPSTMSGRRSPVIVTGVKRTVSPGRSWPSFHRSPVTTVAGQTKPPSDGPSGPSSTGMSPV